MQFFRQKLNRNKSRTAVYVDVRSCFRHLLLLVLLMLLLAATAAAAAAALMLVGPAQCFFIVSTLLRKLYDECCT